MILKSNFIESMRKICLYFLIVLVSISGLMSLEIDDFYPGIFTVCFSADMVGNTRGDFVITHENGIVSTPFDWFNQLAEEYQIVNLTQKYRVKNQDWNLDGQYPSNVYRIEVSSNKRGDTEAMNELLSSLRANNQVLFAEREAVYRTYQITTHNSQLTTHNSQLTTFTPNDPLIPQQWALEKVQAFEAWDIQTGSPDIVIGVVDSGLKWEHADLQENIWINEAELPGVTIDWYYGWIEGGDCPGPDTHIPGEICPGDNDGNGFCDDVMGWDFWSTTSGGESNNPFQNFNGHWHGTHVGGIAAATGNNGVGIAGLAYNSTLIATKHGPFNVWSTAIENPYAGIYYMVDTGIRIINCSWGGSYPGAEQEANLAGSYAYEHGSLIIASAGNSGANFPNYPAAGNHIFSVASTTSSDLKSSFSTYGDWVDISAPGSEILSTVFDTAGNDRYEPASGTSMAAPMVSGLAALILSQDPDLTVDEIKEIIMEGADPIDHLNPQFAGQLGAGRINAFNSVELAQSFEYDLNARSISGPLTLLQEDSYTYNIVVRNRGSYVATGFNIRLMQEGSNIPLSTLTVSTNLEPGVTQDFTLNWVPAEVGAFRLYGQIVWSADENPRNDNTALLDINVLPKGLTAYNIGDPESDLFNNSAFVNYYWGHCLTQTIYLKEELQIGMIYSMSVYFDGIGDIRAGTIISLYMANTTQASFETNSSWIPFSDFTEVYTGNLLVSSAGFYEVSIVLQNPFEYKGENLVVMALKETSAWFDDKNVFQFTENDGEIRSMFWRSDWVPINTNPYPAANGRLKGITNAKFFIDTGHSSEIPDIDLPLTTKLHGNFPNPFNPETNIDFSLATETNVSITIYNIRGQRVRVLIDEIRSKGEHSVVWNGKDDNGQDVSSGVYFYRLSSGEVEQTRRMVLMK